MTFEELKLQKSKLALEYVKDKFPKQKELIFSLMEEITNLERIIEKQTRGRNS